MRRQVDNEPGVFANVVDADTLDGVHGQHLLEQVTHLVKKNIQKVKIKFCMPVSSWATTSNSGLKRTLTVSRFYTLMRPNAPTFVGPAG